jgi:hypothetical protein
MGGMSQCEVTLNEPWCESWFMSHNTRCFQGGKPACIECSHIVRKAFGNRRRVRICNDCLEDDGDRYTETGSDD